MWHALPDEYVRAQAAVGAVVAFGVARVMAAAIGAQFAWRIASVTRVFMALAFVFCLPQLLDVLFAVDTHTAFVELQGKMAGCALALFCAPIVSHRMGYE
jgi:multisubunit Na+/H+ antiporter MnhE subunit